MGAICQGRSGGKEHDRYDAGRKGYAVNNKGVNENRKLFWKGVINAKGGELQQNRGWKWEVGTRRR